MCFNASSLSVCEVCPRCYSRAILVAGVVVFRRSFGEGCTELLYLSRFHIAVIVSVTVLTPPHVLHIDAGSPKKVYVPLFFPFFVVVLSQDENVC